MARLAQLVGAMRDIGLEPTLIGGLAVYVRRHVSTSELDVRAPASLASVPRPTQDVDLAVVYVKGAEQLAANALKDLGLEPASSNPWTFLGENLQVDLIPCLDTWNSDTTFVVEKGRRARPLAPKRIVDERVTDEVSVGVCDRAMLVLQKALAWSERYAARDLADIATLAISNSVEGGAATEDLKDLIESLPNDYSLPLKKVATSFQDEDRSGPSAFFVSVEDSLRQRLVCLTADDENEIRKIASIAVRQLLAPWC